MPKSIAPIESRFAGIPSAWRKMNENISDSGIVSATITAARKLTRNAISTTSTSVIPNSRLCSTVSMVSCTRSLRS